MRKELLYYFVVFVFDTCISCLFVFFTRPILGEQGLRSGESTRLPPMCSGFDSCTVGVICGSSLLFVLVLATEQLSVAVRSMIHKNTE